MAFKIDWVTRFWPKVQKTDSCWLWVGHKDGLGYGRFWKDGKSRLAHVVVWESANGKVPNGLEVRHSCDVRNCVNPDHLSIGTHKENMADLMDRNRQNSNLTQEQMKEVLDLSTSLSRKELAEKFAVSIWCIRDIQRGRSGKKWHKKDLV